MNATDLTHNLRKFIGPGALLLVAIIALVIGFSSETVNQDEVLQQSDLFKRAGLTLLALAVVNLLYVLEIINHLVNMILFVVLLGGAIAMGTMNYYSIMGTVNDPEYMTVRWMEERDNRYEHVKQRMEDIRTAQLAYRDKYYEFCPDFEQLIAFIKNDTVIRIMQDGENPGTMLSREQADFLGYPLEYDLTYMTHEEAIL